MVKLNFKAAGAIFSNNNLVLGGYQYKKKTRFVSGFGGCIENLEKPIETAIRETIEEFFELPIKIPSQLILNINKKIKPTRKVQNSKYKYIFYHYSFNKLNTFLSIVKEYLKKEKIKSPLYEEIPENIDQLIFKRKNYKKAEIKQICLLPKVKNLFICQEFIDDINKIL